MSQRQNEAATATVSSQACGLLAPRPDPDMTRSQCMPGWMTVPETIELVRKDKDWRLRTGPKSTQLGGMEMEARENTLEKDWAACLASSSASEFITSPAWALTHLNST